MLNAYVRCGDMTGAAGLFNDVVSRKYPLVKPDVVLYTTIIKGHCLSGNEAEALRLFRSMSSTKPSVSPNIRTINTLLRGLLVSGKVNEALEVLKLSSQSKVSLDSTSYEIICTLLSQALRFDVLFPMIGRIKLIENTSIDLGSIFLVTARAMCVVGDVKKYRHYAKLCNEWLNKMQTVFSDDAKESVDSSTAAGTGPKAAVGGKRAWREEEDEARQQSLQVYLSHRRQEIIHELSLLAEYSSKIATGLISLPRTEESPALSLCLRVLLLHQYPPRASSSSSAASTALFEALKTSYGLASLVQKSGLSEAVARDRLKSCFGADGRLQYSAIFSQTPLVSAPTMESESEAKDEPKLSSGTRRKIKLEICSGNGDWVVAQAKADPDAYWLACELRNDRCYQIFARALFSSVRNLSILVGDSLVILPTHIPPSSLHCLCINYPEPPTQTHSTHLTTEAVHMLSSQFFAVAETCLRRQATLCVLTDNLWYGRLLVHQIKSDLAAGRLTHLRPMSSVMVQKRNKKHGGPAAGKEDTARWEAVYEEEAAEGCAVQLLAGLPPPCLGHVAPSASYFDRLWKRCRKIDRYFIALLKANE